MINYTFIEKNDEENESQIDHLGNNPHPETITIINCALNVPLILISITGNAVVLVTILRTPSLHSPSILFLCCLAVSDLLVGFIAQPVYIATELNGGPLLYEAMFILSSLLSGVSLCIMAAISVDRYMALHYHMRYLEIMTTKRAMYTLATLWCINMLLSCLSFWKKEVYFFAIATGIATCIAISTFCYIRIYRIVCQHQLQIHVQQQAIQSAYSGDMMRLKKSAINTFMYYMCMILCYSPLFTSMLILAIHQHHETKIWNFADTASFINSSINPFLYCWRLGELRRAVLKTVQKMSCKQTEEH